MVLMVDAGGVAISCKMREIVHAGSMLEFWNCLFLNFQTERIGSLIAVNELVNKRVRSTAVCALMKRMKRHFFQNTF